ncbi:hypothetical protein B0F90DRAFT_1817148 [Multifurca ochricompacta]|uniref:Uncharacterized protein n=1 Tax=Multifurca ochricompacta TaxID=376703 RepID=A0AAD4M672_9AGAM|nr:hypothetical protein B0F90DRAFT_1817148 [Multifurca ochricompacta]
MPKLEEALIERLTLRPDVRDKARALLRTVHSTTGPGTGYDISTAKTGLPAICAYIASKSAGYADITEEVAQKASCLAPKTFASTLRTIKAVLRAPKKPNASPDKLRRDADPTAYATLINEHKIGQPLRVESWMTEAQATLMALPRFQQDWHLLLNVRYEPLVDKHGVSLKIFSRLLNVMDDGCADLKESITIKIREMRKKKKNEVESASNTSTTTPSQSRSASPTKSALRNASLTPSLTASVKRKVAFSLSDASISEEDDGVFAPETPSKRARTTSRMKVSATRVMPVYKPRSVSSEETEDIEMPDATPRFVASQPVAGPSTPRQSRTNPTHAYRTPPSARRQVHSILSDNNGEPDASSVGADTEVDEDDMLPPSRRFRPVFLDRVQWTQRAIRLTRDRTAAEERIKELAKRWGHPFEVLQRAGATGG